MATTLGNSGDNISVAYKLLVKSVQNSGHTVHIWANLPPEFSVRVEAQWSDSQGAGFSIPDIASSAVSGVVDKFGGTFGKSVSPFAGEVAKQVGGTMGLNMIPQFLTRKVYGSPSYIQMQIPLQLQAETDTINEVTDPVKHLMKLASPYKMGNMLVPPGPKLFEDVTQLPSEKISVTLGEYMYFDNVVILDVSPTVKSIFDIESQSQNVEVSLTFSTLEAVSRDDIDNIFIAS